MNHMRGLIFFVIFVLLLGIVHAVPPEQRWIARYNSATNDGDYTRAIAVDPCGNVYVAGQSFRGGQSWDFVTIKYDSNGNQLWEANYNGPVNDVDFAMALVIDKLGYVIVTGVSTGNETGWDYTTVKYDSNGNELWAERYDGPASSMDEARALGIDSFSNVYVTGSSLGNTTYFDFTTVKYDPNGTELWVARYDGPVSTDDEAYALAIDNSGNAYITGTSHSDTSGETYTTIKYDTNGNELWVARPNDPNIDFAWGNAIAVDDLGYVYVTGLCADLTAGLNMNYATVKYDRDGNELWVTFYDGSSRWVDEPSDLVVDSAGNVYVTGYSWDDNTMCNFATVKYNANGNEVWAKIYDSTNDYARAIVLDRLGNVYVAGYSKMDEDYATVSYSPDGEQRWVKVYDYSRDKPHDLAIDNQGSIYVTGESGATTPSKDAVTIKYTERDYCVEAIDGDMNSDCQINFFDFASIAHDWLESYDYVDIDVLSANWLECNYALDTDCWQ